MPHNQTLHQTIDPAAIFAVAKFTSAAIEADVNFATAKIAAGSIAAELGR